MTETKQCPVREPGDLLFPIAAFSGPTAGPYVQGRCLRRDCLGPLCMGDEQLLVVFRFQGDTSETKAICFNQFDKAKGPRKWRA